MRCDSPTSSRLDRRANDEALPALPWDVASLPAAIDGVAIEPQVWDAG